MIEPLEIPLVRDQIMELVGPKHARNTRLVNHAWNAKAIAVLAANDWSVRVCPENIDEYCTSELLRSTPLINRMQIALDFGDGVTLEQFHHLIDTVTDRILPQDGLACVKKLWFRGVARSQKFGDEEYTKLLTFAQLLSAGLRHLYLFDCTWPCDRPLSFPTLVELSYCWDQEGSFLLKHSLLNPGVMSQLTRLNIRTITRGSESYTYNELYLEDVLPALKNLDRLKDLSLELDAGASHHLTFASWRLGVPVLVPLSTVVSLHLHIIEGPNELWSAPVGGFISEMCPELRLLDLEYVAELTTAKFAALFPESIGQLRSLNSLIYRRRILHNTDKSFNREGKYETECLQQLLVTDDPQLLRDSFPNLQNVGVQLDFELSLIERSGTANNLDRLQVPTVTRLEVQVPARAVGGSAMTAFPAAELGRLTSNLHGMYPNISCLALDLQNINKHDHQTPRAIMTIRLLVKEIVGIGNRLMELELLNCYPKMQPEAILLALLVDDSLTRTLLHEVRRIKLTALAIPVPISSWGQKSPANAPPRAGSSLSLTKIVAVLPHLQWLQVDEDFGGGEVTGFYKEAEELKLRNRNLKIEFN